MLITCPSCQRQLNVPDNAVGKQVRCPASDCGTVFFVPAAAPLAAAPPAPAAPAPARAVPRPAVPLNPVPRPAGPAAPAAPSAPAPGPAPAPAGAGSPFDFGGGGGAVGPEADFGFTEHTDGGLQGIGVRTRLGRAAGWLNMAAGTMILYTLFLIGGFIASAVLVGNWWIIAGAACAPFVFLPIPVAIIIGARMLSRGRRWGWAMTAAILALVVGALNLLSVLVFAGLAVMFGLALQHAHVAGSVKYQLIGACSADFLSFLVAALGIYGGFVALRTLRNAEIKRAFS
jgi:hypothetical protein